MGLKDTMEHKDEWKFWALILFFAACMMSIPYFSFEHLDKIDSLFHLNRIEGIKEELLALEIPARINGYALNGYGTADSVMYPDLLLYLPAVLRIFGLSVSLSWNVTWIVIIFFGVFFSWVGYSLWTKNIRAGAIASLFYISVYIFQIVTGGMIGCVPVYFMLPLAMAMIVLILQDSKNAKLWSWFTIIFSFFIQNHIPSTIIFSVFIFCCCVYYREALKNEEQRRAILKILLFAFLLNIWRILPFIYFYETVSFQINHPSWVNSFEEVTRSFSQLLRYQFYLGFPLLAAVIFLLKEKIQCRAFICVVSLNFFLILMCSKIFPWSFIENNLPFGKVLLPLQLPERFLPFGFVLLCLFIGKFISEKLGAILKNKFAAVAILLFVAFTFSQESVIRTQFPEFLPELYGYNRQSFDVLPSYTTEKYHVQEDYLYSDVHFHKLRNEKGEVYSSRDFKTEAKIFDIKKQGSRLEFSYSADRDAKVQVPLFYWEGYEATTKSGENLKLGFNENRFMEVYVKRGEDQVKIHYAGLWVFRMCDWISLISAMLLLIRIFKTRP